MEAPILPRKKASGPASGQPADRGQADCQNKVIREFRSGIAQYDKGDKSRSANGHRH
jgi:hypothetical protein